MQAFAHASLALRRASGAAASASSSIRIFVNLSDASHSIPAFQLSAAASDSFSRSLSSSSSSLSTSTSSSSSSSALSLPPSARSDFAYCADLVRKNDPENYLWVAELPKSERAVALALRAFNVETAMAADSASAHSKKEGVPSSLVSSSGIGTGEHQRALAAARLLWWKEAVIAAAAANPSTPPPDHPVARAIAAVAASGAVSPRSLSARLARVAGARADDAAFSTTPSAAAAAPFATMRDLENYGENTAAQLLYLQLEAAGARSADADHAASHLGRAAAIAALLRGMKSHASISSSSSITSGGGIGNDGQRRCYLPLSELEAAGTSPRELFAVVDSRARARERREKQRQQQQQQRGGGGAAVAAAAAADSNNGDDDDDDPLFFPDSLRRATRAVASAALSHLSAARELGRERLKDRPPKCFLQAVGVARYLRLLEECCFDPLAADEAALGSAAARARYRVGLAVRTKWCSWRGRY